MFNRRQLLIAGGIAAGSLAFGEMLRAAAHENRELNFGWIDDPVVRSRHLRTAERPFVRNFGQATAGTSAGKSRLLWPIFERITKKKFQPFSQTIGDCCGEAGTMGAQVLAAVQASKRNEDYKGPFSVEYTYAASRVEIGKGYFGRYDGSTGLWTAEALQKCGVLRRDVYGKYDLRTYRPDLGRLWGKPGIGVPDELEKIAKVHPVKTKALVESFDQGCDLIENGYPIILCSGVGYGNQTDKDGFLPHLGIRWDHAMLWWGFDRRARKRQGGCIANSWDVDWLTGPRHELGTPDGCFWSDEKNIEKAISQGDCYALSDYVGYPRVDLDYLLY